MSMIVALGTSTPTSTTLVATSTSASPRTNRSIRSAFSRRACGRGAARREGPGTRAVLSRSNSAVALRAPELVGLLDERADDERLAALVHLGPDELVGARALVAAGNTLRLDRPAAGGHLAQFAEVDVAVRSVFESERRDGRRGHGQVVGHRPGGLRGASDVAPPRNDAARRRSRDRGWSQHDVVLDERMGADDEQVVPCSQAGQNLPSRPPPRAPAPGARRQARAASGAGQGWRSAAAPGSRSAP